jgi:hypothetical protein
MVSSSLFIQSREGGFIVIGKGFWRGARFFMRGTGEHVGMAAGNETNALSGRFF